MKRIGLTGNLGMGKSTVAALLSTHGVATITTDDIVHELLCPHTKVWQALFQRYGSRILLPGNVIDRPTLATIIFNDPVEQKFLEGLIHPHVLEVVQHRCAELQKKGTPYVVIEVPLLFEVHWESHMDLVVVVTCPEEQAIERAMGSLSLTREEAIKRLKTQWPMDKKLARADVILDTSGTLEETRVQVERLYHRWERGDFSGTTHRKG